jgi:tape measure domain-containing protein
VADARTTIRFDSVGAEKVKKDYADIIAADKKTGDGLKKTGGAASGAAVDINRLGNSTKAYAAQATVAATRTNSLVVGLSGFARIGGALAVGAAGAMAVSAVRAADRYNVLQGRIKEATRATGDYNSVSRELFAIAQSTGTALESNVELFQRMAAGAREFGATNTEILQVTETIQQLGILGGSSLAAMSAGTTQFAQAMSAGVVRAEEWNSIVENLPSVALAIADALGKSVGEIRQMVIDGKLLSEVVFDGLAGRSADVAKRMEAIPMSIERASTKLRDAWAAAAAGTDAVAGTTSAIVEGMDRLADALPGIVTRINEIVGGFLEVLKLGGFITRDKEDSFRRVRNILTGAEKGFFTPEEAETVGLPYNKGFSREQLLARLEANYEAFKIAEGYVRAASGQFRMPVRVGGSLANARIETGGQGGAAPNPEKDARDRARAIKDAQEHEEAMGRAARATRGWSGALGEASSAARGVGDTIRANEADYQSFLADIEQETRLLGLSNEAREIEIALLEARARLNVETLTPQQTAEVMGAIDRNRAARAAKEAADEVEQIWLRARDNVSDAWSDFLFDIFDKGKISFKSFANDLKSIWARTIADMIAQSTQQSIVEPLFNALFGGAGGSAGVFSALKNSAAKDVANMPDIFGSSAEATGLSGFFKKNLTDPLKGVLGTKAGASTIGGALGGAAMGYGIGQLTGSGQGGAVGGAIGTMIGGPIGGLIGGIFGGLIGGLFKSTPKSIASISTTGGLAGVGATYAQGLDEKIGKSMGGGVTNALNAIAEELDATLTEDYFLGMIGQRGKKFFFQEQQSDIKKAGKGSLGAVKFESAEEAIAAAIEAAIKNGVIQGLSTAEEELLRAADDVNQALQDIVNGRNFRREVELSFIGLTNPMAADLARLSDQYAEQKKLAEKYGADMVKLEAIYQASRKEIIEQYQEQQFSSLKALLTSLTSGSASPLSPTTRLGLAETRYNSLRAAAMRGDDAAIEQLAGAATDFLDAAKAVYATSDGYFSRYNAVIDDVSKITGVANPLTAGVQAVNDNYKAQIAQGERAIAQRAETNTLLRVIASNLGASTSATQRAAAATTTNNGVAQIGGFTPESIQKLVAGIRF